MIDIAERPIAERYEHLVTTITSDRFLGMQGLGNEVPFFICPFKPQEFDEMSKLYDQLGNTLANKGIQVLKINLYDLSIEILKDRGIWDRVINSEPKMKKKKLWKLLSGVLDVENYLIPTISKKMAKQDFDVMFITGVGKVFPYIRSHTVLNNLQSKAKEKPTVMFFPGEYKQSIEEGASLNLFNRLIDDNYYRAFNIYKHF